MAQQKSTTQQNIVQDIGNATQEIAQGIAAFGQSIGEDSKEILGALKGTVSDFTEGQNAKQAK